MQSLVDILNRSDRATERIILGTAVTPTYPRHPFTLAAQAVALAGLAKQQLIEVAARGYEGFTLSGN